MPLSIVLPWPNYALSFTVLRRSIYCSASDTKVYNALFNTCRFLLIRDTRSVYRRERRNFQQPKGAAKIYRKTNAKWQIQEVCHQTLIYERPGYLSNNNWIALNPFLVMTLGLSSRLKEFKHTRNLPLASMSSHGATSFNLYITLQIWIYKTHYPNSSFITVPRASKEVKANTPHCVHGG
jgi:hypothetical protein